MSAQKISHYNPITFIIDFTTNLDIDLVPENFINLELPEYNKEKELLKYNPTENRVDIISNYNTVYSTLTKEQKTVEPGYTLGENETDLKPTEFSIFDPNTNNWIYSEQLEKNHWIDIRTKEIESKFQKRLVKGVNCNGFNFRIDEKSRLELTSAASRYSANGKLPPSWISEYRVDEFKNKISGTENEPYPIYTVENFNDLVSEFGDSYQALFFVRRARIDALTKLELEILKNLTVQDFD